MQCGYQSQICPNEAHEAAFAFRGMALECATEGGKAGTAAAQAAPTVSHAAAAMIETSRLLSAVPLSRPGPRR